MIQPPIAQAKKEKSPKGLVKNASGADTHTTEIRAQKIIVPAINRSALTISPPNYTICYIISKKLMYSNHSPLQKNWQIKTKYVLTCQV